MRARKIKDDLKGWCGKGNEGFRFTDWDGRKSKWAEKNTACGLLAM